MHKNDAAALFKVLSDGDRVKMLKKLYMLKSLSLNDFKEIIESDEKTLIKDLDMLVDSKLMVKNGDNYLPNYDLIDELMNFIKTPCGCKNNKTRFKILAYDQEFIFEKDEKECAWYDFDHMVSENNGSTLRIDANRDVYAFFKKDDNSIEIQGTIRDDDENILADNYVVDNNYTYHFVKSKKQGYFD